MAADEYFHTPVQGILARTPAHLIHFIARPVSLSLVWRHVLGQCAQVRWRWLRWQGGEGPRREKEARARPVDHALVRQGMTIHGKWPCIVYAIRIDNTNTYNAVLYSMPLATRRLTALRAPTLRPQSPTERPNAANGTAYCTRS